MTLCDYRDLPYSGGGTNHGPAVTNRGGYNICQKCSDAITRAEIESDKAYKRANAEYVVNVISRELQRRCFL